MVYKILLTIFIRRIVMSTKEETKVELKTTSEISEPCFEFVTKRTPPINFCRNGLFFMALAHEFGNIKYEKYSWRNDPEGSNSLPEDSLNAILRHVTLMQMGFKYDSETKFFHLGHALARTQSLVSNTYRKILNKTDKKIDTRHFSKMLFSTSRVDLAYDSDYINLFDQISPEVLYSLGKMNDSLVSRMLPTEKDASSYEQSYLDVVQKCGIALMIVEKDIDINILQKNILLEDLILYNLLFLARTFTEDDIQYALNWYKNLPKKEIE